MPSMTISDEPHRNAKPISALLLKPAACQCRLRASNGYESAPHSGIARNIAHGVTNENTSRACRRRCRRCGVGQIGCVGIELRREPGRAWDAGRHPTRDVFRTDRCLDIRRRDCSRADCALSDRWRFSAIRQRPSQQGGPYPLPPVPMGAARCRERLKASSSSTRSGGALPTCWSGPR